MKDNLEIISAEMASIYMINSAQNYKGVYQTTEDGLEHLKEVFEEVDIDNRGQVFGEFLSILERSGVISDKGQFI